MAEIQIVNEEVKELRELLAQQQQLPPQLFSAAQYEQLAQQQQQLFALQWQQFVQLQQQQQLPDSSYQQQQLPDSSYQQQQQLPESYQQQQQLPESSYQQQQLPELPYHQQQQEQKQRRRDFDEFCRLERSEKKRTYQKIKEIDGDLFAQPKEFSLGHCVAEDMAMRSGIAKRFRRDFKRVDELISQKQKQGGLAVLRDGERCIYYLVTKRVSNGKPTYSTLFNSLKKNATAHAR